MRAQCSCHQPLGRLRFSADLSLEWRQRPLHPLHHLERGAEIPKQTFWHHAAMSPTSAHVRMDDPSPGWAMTALGASSTPVPTSKDLCAACGMCTADRRQDPVSCHDKKCCTGRHALQCPAAASLLLITTQLGVVLPPLRWPPPSGLTCPPRWTMWRSTSKTHRQPPSWRSGT